MIIEHANTHQAARELGIWPSALYEQLALMEHGCGGPSSTAAAAENAPAR